MQKKKTLLNCSQIKSIVQKECFGTEIVFVPIEVLFAISPFCKIGKAVIKRRIKAAERILRKQNVDIIMGTDECEKVLGYKDTQRICTDGIPQDELINCFHLCQKKTETIAEKSDLVLVDRYLDFVNFKIMSELCLCAKNIYLKTDCKDEAYELADEIFAKFGLWIEVINYDTDINISPVTMLVDANCGTVRMGDMVVNGVDYGIDCMGYNIDMPNLVFELKKYSNLKIKRIKSGKHLIKVD